MLGLGPGPEQPWDAVLELLAGSAVLLVLDGCEHVLDEVHVFADAVLRSCPHVSIVATSRVRMGLSDEVVIPLEPLTVAAPEDASTPTYDLTGAAERLLVDRVRRLRPTFTVVPEHHGTLRELCERLDGLPLALEMVAPQVATLGLVPACERLNLRDELSGKREFGQSTILGLVVERSLDLVGPHDRNLLVRLTAFAGPFGLASLTGLCECAADSGDGSDDDVTAGLLRLVEASLVAVVPEGATIRFRLLETIRAAVVARADAGERQEGFVAHSEWVARTMESCAERSVGSECEEAYRTLGELRVDVVGAPRWSLGNARTDAAERIVGALGLCSHWFPGRELSALIAQVTSRLDELLPHPAPLTLGAGAFAAVERGDTSTAERLGSRALRTARTRCDSYLALLSLALAALYSGQLSHARDRFVRMLEIPDLPDAYQADARSSLALIAGMLDQRETAASQASSARDASERSGAQAHHAFALYVTGELLLLHTPGAALDVLSEAVTRADSAHADHVSAVARIALLSAKVRGDDLRDARSLALELLDTLRIGLCWPHLWTCLRIVAELFVRAGYHSDAELVLAAADANPTAPPPAGCDITRYLRLREQISGQIGVDTTERIDVFASVLARGEVADRALRGVQRLEL